jgi:hypothetical protein
MIGHPAPTGFSMDDDLTAMVARMLAESESALTACAEGDTERLNLTLVNCDDLRRALTPLLEGLPPEAGGGKILEGLVKLQGVQGRLGTAIEQRLCHLFAEIQQLDENTERKVPYGRAAVQPERRIDLFR